MIRERRSANRWQAAVSRLGRIILVVAVAVGCQRQESPAEDQAVRQVSPAAVVVENPSPQESPEARIATATHEPQSHTPPVASDDPEVARYVPAWVSEAVFYQIFPERFRNGDPKNDPIRESLENVGEIPQTWQITPWSADWYARAAWEREMSDNFYELAIYHRRYGGDLQGVLDKLDYLEDLGVNAIYFNPVFYAKSLHKYDGASMHHIDPYFGPDPAGDLALMAKETSDPKTWQWTAADKLFLQLVEELHRRKMHVIIDGVFNHTGRDFFAFANLREKQEQSPYKEWYIVQYFDDPQTPQNDFRYKSWWGFDTLPEFADNQARDDLHPGPKAYVFDITRRWMDPNGDGDPSDGIDGWRLDVANEVPMGFWSDWNNLVRELNPQAYTVGEFWDNAHDHLLEGHFSGTMNYHGFAYLAKGFLVDDTLTPHDFGRELQARLQEYPRSMQFAMQNLIDSHDTQRVGSMTVNAGHKPYLQPDRFDYDCSERVSPRYDSDFSCRKPNARELQIQRMVALMQICFVGPPMVYYGSESGMWGGDDPDNRMPMIWDDLAYEDQAADPLNRSRTPDPVQFDASLHDYYRQIIGVRTGSEVLQHGDFQALVSDDDAKVFAFRRSWQGKHVLVVINRGNATYSWEVPCEAGGLQVLATASASSDAVSVVRRDGVCVVTVPALEAAVLSEHNQPE
jgi:cyclomaltodextrinase / maltogenic alpha-amylase / neopullulanase